MYRSPRDDSIFASAELSSASVMPFPASWGGGEGTTNHRGATEERGTKKRQEGVSHDATAMLSFDGMEVLLGRRLINAERAGCLALFPRCVFGYLRVSFLRLFCRRYHANADHAVQTCFFCTQLLSASLLSRMWLLRICD